MIRVPKILLGPLFMACASSADTVFADTLFLYQISYDATSGPIQSFSASFVSQSLLTGSSGAFAFNPFTISDGTNTWVMGKGIATRGGGVPGGQCLNFATLENFLLACRVQILLDQKAGGFVVFFGDSLPTQPGTFTPDQAFGEFTVDPNTVESFQVPGTGSFNFKITEVPEPSSLAIVGFTGLLGLGYAWRRCKRWLFR